MAYELKSLLTTILRYFMVKDNFWNFVRKWQNVTNEDDDTKVRKEYHWFEYFRCKNVLSTNEALRRRFEDGE